MNLLLLIPVLIIPILFLVFRGPQWKKMTIKIDDNVPGDHTQIERETRNGVEFYCLYHKIDHDKFKSGLKIHVKNSIPGVVCGLYIFPRKHIEIEWLGGIRTNSLFHELMHHHCMVHGKSEYKHQTDEQMKRFKGVIRSLQTCVDAFLRSR